MRIGILGGTFDPIHHGHLLIAESARTSLELEWVIFIPTGYPWMRPRVPISPAKHRINMVCIAIASNPFFLASPIEIDRPGATYTVDTLIELRRDADEGDRLFFILGVDALSEFPRWKEPGKVLELCTLVPAKRPGWGQIDMTPLSSVDPSAADNVVVLEAPLVDISGTEIRRRVAAGLSVRYQVPNGVDQYMQYHGLYREKEGPP